MGKRKRADGGDDSFLDAAGGDAELAAKFREAAQKHRRETAVVATPRDKIRFVIPDPGRFEVGATVRVSNGFTIRHGQVLEPLASAEDGSTIAYRVEVEGETLIAFAEWVAWSGEEKNKSSEAG